MNSTPISSAAVTCAIYALTFTGWHFGAKHQKMPKAQAKAARLILARLSKGQDDSDLDKSQGLRISDTLLIYALLEAVWRGSFVQRICNIMVHFTLSDGLAVWELIYYVVALICSVVVSYRHGLSRGSGWIFLTILSTIRVIGCSAQIATVTATSGTAETIATIAGFLGLSPLLLATLGILSRVYFSILELPWNLAFGFFIAKIVQLPTVVALILCIIGAASATTPADITNQDSVKAAVIVYLIVFILLAFLTMGAGITSCMSNRRGESTLLHVVAASLPLLLLRIIHSLLLVFSKQFQDSAAKASTLSILTELFMAKVEEMIVVLLFLYGGLTQRAVPEKENGALGNGEKLAYRAARGDFSGGTLGVASLAIAAAGALFSRKGHEEV